VRGSRLSVPGNRQLLYSHRPSVKAAREGT
jgi:hypothetical protein